jgi:transmembrane sensor
VNTSREDQIQESIEQRATEWFVRHREGALAPCEQRQYLDWLRASPRHVQAYLNLIALSGKIPQAIRGLGIDTEALASEVAHSPAEAERALFCPQIYGSEERCVERKPHAFRGRQFLIATVALVLLAIGSVAFWGSGPWGAPASFNVPAGQQRIVTLADGSSIHLNSSTRVRVRYSQAQRLIELTEGQALFSVTHDARRPFIVRAGTMDVVALGTRFDVIRRAGHTQVTVVEGRIEVLADEPSPPPPVRLAAGEQVKITDETHVGRISQVDAATTIAWTHKPVSFASERLQEVALQFSRTTGTRIEIEDAQLRDYRISGVFQAYDVDSFLAYLAQFEGVRIERDGDDIIVRR